ncbi:MAG: D-alanine-D-alanine ligase-like protein [Candidatus Gottesmanbacteria bacterium GW2011_GWC2_39_8]|uniref:D-alanine-D-alanine ligase-like protein n=1 Tax=Candidatus Gottesmanbacteria bacterium GW2011_GWC2_39_8 TaxID=1618450 RepID=A0A0G0Q2L2_9BACT|nr:MAG: D-alanine-D-alanine ligase-like protein [Candidatus Gottesmanbacteria bacterium GW2011_GWC2_39_8]
MNTAQINQVKKITILHNIDTSFLYGEEDILVEKEYQDDINSIRQVFDSSGFQTELYEVDENTFDGISDIKTDFFFNLSYGIGSVPKTEDKIPKLLATTGIPYSGATAEGLLLTTDKALTKKVFQENGIPTPRYQLFENPNTKIDKSLTFPLFVKPVAEDCSVGIDNNSIVENQRQLKERINLVLSTYKQPALVEKYINTREFRIPMIGNGEDITILPISELVFGPSFTKNNLWKIDDFETKFVKESIKYKDTNIVCPAKLDPEIEREIKEFSLLAYRKIGARDYARIDIRLDEGNSPYFLEVNMNPGLGLEDTMITSAKAAGYTYDSFILKLLNIALSRSN